MAGRSASGSERGSVGNPGSSGAGTGSSRGGGSGADKGPESYLVVLVADGQDFEVRMFDGRTGRPGYAAWANGSGPWGVHGKMSAAVQNGRVILFNKDKLQW